MRAFQGKIGVNKEIRQSLNEQGGPDFWWLNNGVTVICSRVFSQGKQFNLDDVQIVNGLQTSYNIFQAGKENGIESISFSRLLLVRIIETEDGVAKDNIIRATNRQTAVSEASLKATDELQRQIERLFESRGLYYDRRKNYYRNEKKARGKIVSINALAQAVMAMGLSRPDDARARPSNVFREDEEYQKVFHERVPIEIYLWAAKTQREVNQFLQTPEANADRQERTNLRFYVSMLVAARRLGKRVRAPGELAKLVAGPPLGEGELQECLKVSREVMARLTEEEGDLPDRVAKGPRLGRQVLAAVGLQ